jgi:hypothetical protein
LLLQTKEQLGPSLDNAFAQAAATTDSSGAFVFAGVPECVCTFQIAGLPSTAYISDILSGSASIFDSGLTVGAEAPEQIQVLVNLAGSSVEGTVQNAARHALGAAQVVLVPQQSRRGNTALYKFAISDAGGHFVLRGVAPGQYKVFAWESGTPAFAYMNATFMARFEDRGMPVNISTAGLAGLNVVAIK